MNERVKHLLLIVFLWLASAASYAQGDAGATARIDATHITVGDQVRVFIEVHNNASLSKLQWAAIPDTFNNLEVVERGKIDTVKQGDVTTYKQRLLVTGFDSGSFFIPSFIFPVIPNSGTAYTVQTDSFRIDVQTVSVDTTKAFKPIKGIIFVKGSWLDYIWYIVGGVVLLLLIIGITIYFATRKKPLPPPVQQGPVETLQEYTMRLLNELDAQSVWQKGNVKEYYVQLTDIIRDYIEARFKTSALELTTDEILYKVQLNKELRPYHSLLSSILHTADLAKFAKAQPLPQEHVEAMEHAKEFVNTSKPVAVTETTPPQP